MTPKEEFNRILSDHPDLVETAIVLLNSLLREADLQKKAGQTGR